MVLFLGADFTAAKGISVLIKEFTQRKQPLYFLKPREEVISVFKGAALEDFRYINSTEELEVPEGKILNLWVYKPVFIFLTFCFVFFLI